MLRSALLEADASGPGRIWIRRRRLWSEPVQTSWNGIACYSVGTPRGWPGGRWLAALQLAWIFRRHRVRLAHLHWSGVDHWGFALHLRFHRLPYVLTFHAFNARRLEAMGLLDARVLRRLARDASRLSAVSGALKEQVCELCPEARAKMEIVPNGVSTSRASARPPSRLPDDFILSVGTFCSLKGADLLPLAFFDLWKSGRLSAPLVLCGQDEPKGQLRRLVSALGLEDRLLLVPDCPHEKVLALMSRCRFFVSASREEAFGMAILEAMAHGKAVAAPRVGGIPEYVAHERNGLLFEPEDLEGLKRAVLRLDGDEPLRRRLGRQAEATAARFSWPQARQAYRRLHEEALAAVR